MGEDVEELNHKLYRLFCELAFGPGRGSESASHSGTVTLAALEHRGCRQFGNQLGLVPVAGVPGQSDPRTMVENKHLRGAATKGGEKLDNFGGIQAPVMVVEVQRVAKFLYGLGGRGVQGGRGGGVSQPISGVARSKRQTRSSPVSAGSSSVQDGG